MVQIQADRVFFYFYTHLFFFFFLTTTHCEIIGCWKMILVRQYLDLKILLIFKEKLTIVRFKTQGHTLLIHVFFKLQVIACWQVVQWQLVVSKIVDLMVQIQVEHALFRLLQTPFIFIFIQLCINVLYVVFHWLRLKRYVYVIILFGILKLKLESVGFSGEHYTILIDFIYAFYRRLLSLKLPCLCSVSSVLVKWSVHTQPCVSKW